MHTPAERRASHAWAITYLLVAAMLVLAMASHLANDRRSTDVHLHAATIESLAQNLWHPQNPMVDSDDPDAGFSPYGMALGVFARVTGWSGYDVLDAAAIVTLILFLMLLRPAIRVLVGDDAPAALALLFTLFAWGSVPWRWSGYLNINSIGFGLGYPSMASWCALLAGVLLADRLQRRTTRAMAVALGLTLAFIALTHPITLLGALPLSAAVALRGRIDRRLCEHLAGALVVCVAVALAWPTYSILELLTASGRAYDLPNKGTYLGVPQRTFLALIGAVPLAIRARRNRRDPLVLTAGVAAAVFTVGALAGRWTAGRALPFLIFALHVAAAAWLVERVDRGRRSTRWAALLAAATVCAVGAAGSTDGLLAIVPRPMLPASLQHDRRTQSELAEWELLDEAAPGSIVLATDLRALRAAPGRGLRTVAPGFATPYIDDLEQRRRASERYLVATPAERATIVEQYHVRYLLLSEDQENVDLTGHRLVAQGAGHRLYLVPQD